MWIKTAWNRVRMYRQRATIAYKTWLMDYTSVIKQSKASVWPQSVFLLFGRLLLSFFVRKSNCTAKRLRGTPTGHLPTHWAVIPCKTQGSHILRCPNPLFFAKFPISFLRRVICLPLLLVPSLGNQSGTRIVHLLSAMHNRCAAKLRFL